MADLVRVEKIAIAFLIVLFLAGVGVVIWKKSCQEVRIDVSRGAMSAVNEGVSRGRFAAKGPVDINTAARDELVRLPGVGPALADRIIAYREKEGRFHSTEEITKVRGIGPALFGKIKDSITAD